MKLIIYILYLFLSLFPFCGFSAGTDGFIKIFSSFNSSSIKSSNHLPLQSDTLLAHQYFEKAKRLADSLHTDSYGYDKAFAFYRRSAVLYKKNAMWKRYMQCYNSIGSVLTKNSAYDQALAYLDTALEITHKQESDWPVLIADNHNFRATIYRIKGAYDEALAYWEKALDIIVKTGEQGTHTKAKLYNSIGLIHADMGNMDRGLEYHEKALSIMSEQRHPKYNRLVKVYFDIANIYRVKGNLSQTKVYYEKTLALALEKLGANHFYTALSYQGIGGVYQYTGTYDKALEYYEKSLWVFLKILKAKSPDLAALYRDIANVHMFKGLYEKALMYHQKALDVQIEILGTDHPQVALTYHDIGTVYHNGGLDYQKALEYYQKAITIYHRIWAGKHPELSVMYRNRALLHSAQGLFEQSLGDHQKAIMALVPDFYEEDPMVNPPLLTGSDDYHLLFALLLKAITFKEYYSEVSHNRKDLEQATATFLLATQLTDQIKRGYHIERAKLSLSAQLSMFYHIAAQISLELDESGSKDGREQAFFFSEKNKATTLLEALDDSQAKTFAGIPDSLLEKEHQLKVALSYYETTIQKQKRKMAYDTAVVKDYEARFFDLKRDYEALVKNFERDYPKYYKLKYDGSVAGIQEVQERLPDTNTVLVSYFTSAENMLIFSITKTDFLVQEIAIDSTFHKQLNSLQHFLTDQSSAKKTMNNQDNYEQYTRAASEVYNRLLKAVLEEQPRIDRLIIVPDDALVFLPFETLLYEPVDTNAPASYYELPYLIRNYQIHYEYSASLYARSSSDNNTLASGSYAGFAPVYPSEKKFADNIGEALRTYTERGDLSPLQHNQPEVKSIAQIVGGKAFLGDQATEAQF